MPNCSEIMTKDPDCCVTSATTQDVARLMKVDDIGPVPVVNDLTERKLVGIITDRDLALKVVAEGRDPTSSYASEVMSSNVVTCKPTDDVETAISLMEEHQVRRLPVVEAENKLVGIISQADIATRLEKPEKTAELVEAVSA